MSRRGPKIVVMLLAIGLMVPSIAAAQGTNDNAWKFGGRAGFGLAPDQFIIGGHVESPALPQKFLEKVTLRPTFELSFGDDLTVAQVMLDFVLWVPIPDSRFQAYAVAGPGIEFIDDRGGLVGFGVGVQHDRGFFGELRYQNGQARVVGGFTFTRR